MLGLAILAVTLLAQAPAEEPKPALAERTTIAGLEGILCTSTLTYEDASEPHELVAMYAFPDRAKWHLSLIGGSAHDRQIEYRSGDTCWRIEPARSDSRRMNAVERDHQIRRMELRRALLLWPHGFDWERRSGGWRADLGPLGHFEAAPGPGELPERIESFDADGRPLEALFELGWRKVGERSVPARARLSVEGALVWTEVFTEVSIRARFLDHTFVPPDRLGDLDLETRARRVELAPESAPAATRLRASLEPGVAWSVAIERAQTLRVHAQRSLGGGRALAPGVEFELSPGGRPVAVLLTLATAVEPAPPGWAHAPAHERLLLTLEGFPGRDVAEQPGGPDGTEETRARGGLGPVLEQLRTSVPPGRRAGPARLWLSPGPADSEGGPLEPGTPLRLALPLEPAGPR